MSELEAKLKAKIAECIAEYTAGWEQPRPVGDMVMGRKPSGNGLKMLAKGRWLSILPRHENGSPLAIAILESLNLPVSGRVRLWRPSVREDRALVLWEQTGDISPVRMSCIRNADKVKSLALIVEDFGNRRSTKLTNIGSCRGLEWT